MLYDPKWTPAETEIQLEPWQQILLKAADILEEKNWIQGEMDDRAGGYCMMGAMQVAIYGTTTIVQDAYYGHVEKEKDHHPVYIQGLGKLGAAISDIPVHEWNDRKGRTKAEVIAKLREVAHAV